MVRYFIFCLLYIFATGAQALDVSMLATADGSSRPIIKGKTNLPDGTSLIVGLYRSQGNYNAQNEVTVYGGEFSTQPFSSRGDDLSPGVYSLEITMPIARVQSQRVKDVIGDEGQHLRGKLVKNSAYGSKVVNYKTNIKIGSGRANKIADKRAKDSAKKDREEWLTDACRFACAKEYSPTVMREPFQMCFRGCLKEALK